MWADQEMTKGIEVTPTQETTGYRVRLKFRVQKQLYSDMVEQSLSIDGREVSLKPAAKGQKLSDAKWLVMSARHFNSEQEALDFGLRLKRAVELSAVCSRLGVDCGTDAATLSLGAEFRQHLLATTGQLFRDNVHGLDVFLDDPKIVFLSMSAEASSLIVPDQFFAGIEEFHSQMGQVSQEVSDILLLMNFALMNPEPVAQIVFAVSAVEMIGQRDASWSAGQKALIKRLEALARSDTSLPAEEVENVADAIKRIHKVSLRQGVIRLLRNLGSSDLFSEWEQLYSERSSLVHGLAPRPGGRYEDLANRTLSLCGRILLKAIAREVAVAERGISFYPVPGAGQ